MQLNEQDLKILLPLACDWVKEQEQNILNFGIPLTDEQLKYALRIGIQNPNKIRLLKVDKIPMPTNPQLIDAANITKLVSPRTIGLTVRYGIFIREDHWGQCSLIVHEMVHTMQYEKLGSIEAFLEKYLLECFTLGYPNTPMEEEAERVRKEICANS